MKEKITSFLKLKAKVPKWLRNKYTLTALFFVVWLSFIDNDSFLAQYQLYEQHQDLTKKNKQLEIEIKNLTTYIGQLKNNPSMIEKYARENYLLKRDNETLFIYERKNTSK